MEFHLNDMVGVEMTAETVAATWQVVRVKKYLFIIHSMYHQFQFISIYLFPILWIKNKFQRVEGAFCERMG